MNLEIIKLKLGITDDTQDNLLTILMSDAMDYMKVYLNVTEIPTQLKFISEEVAIKRYRRLGSEGISTEKIDVLSTTYSTDDFGEYKSIMDIYINKTVTKGYRLF